MTILRIYLLNFSQKMKNKDGSEKKKPVKDAKTRNRLPKNVILPESRYPVCDGILNLFLCVFPS